MKDFIDKTSEKSGTPINREAMMAVQGFMSQNTTFNKDGSVVETNADGHTKTTTFPDKQTVVEVFAGEEFTITKTTTFNSDDTITEVIS